MSEPIVQLRYPELGLPGALARWMTQPNDRGDMSFGMYCARVVVSAGLLALLACSAFGYFGAFVAPKIFAASGVDVELIEIIGISSAGVAIYAITVAASGIALLAAAGLLADKIGFWSDRRVDLS